MRNGESGQLRGQRVREVVGELQFVRKLHFPLSSSFPPGCTLYLTNPAIHPFQLVDLTDTYQIAVLCFIFACWLGWTDLLLGRPWFSYLPLKLVLICTIDMTPD